ncbi:hypothetical protein SAMN05880501_106218 [Ureibacillus xyleni]|uniref:DUF4871 domain-containing protein n=1 Tax=Ureibacillus xyleni TaxID=614648 RepID=A0A285SUG3_9BACL|nr:hypothetical protein [Ureibacillus xyleni]SOC11579.1 hypothetical protein SAMN05880501_106218 [Ureibacillus xyleni]
MRIKLFLIIGVLFFMIGCTEKEKAIVLPDGIPDFVKESDFDSIDWEKKAVQFGDRGVVGNENKSGVIGADMPSLNNGQKWMWHLWDVKNLGELTVVGYHRESEKVQQILSTGWSIQLGGENNGADAHVPSSVIIPEKGEWAMLLYVDEQLFDILVFDIQE